MVKDELNAEEKFFENAVKTERFVKKYKTKLIGIAIAVAIVIGANAAYEYVENNKAEASNAALTALQTNSEDKEALNILKEQNPKLYDLYMLSVAIKSGDEKTLGELKSSTALGVSDLATYQLASLQKDMNALSSYANGQDAIYKDMAAVQSAVLLMQSGKTEQAHRKLATVSSDSPVYKIAQSLLHYGVK